MRHEHAQVMHPWIEEEELLAPVGVMVMALGTPAGPDDIEAYYTRMRGGHPPSPALLSDLQRRYAAIGSRSPLLERTQAQVRGLQAALDQVDPGRFRVAPGMQHSRPFTEDSLAELVASGVQRVVGLVLAPHYSRLSVGVYRERLKAANTSSFPLTMIEHWHLATWLFWRPLYRQRLSRCSASMAWLPTTSR